MSAPPVAEIETSLELTSAESIVLDGANGVTSAPRAHFPHGTVALSAALALAVLAALGIRLFKKRASPALGLLLIVAALPGLVRVLAVRADAPLKRGEMADSVRLTLADLQGRVPWPETSVQLIREEDDVLFPLGRYAVPSRPPRAGTGVGVELELRSGPLGRPCWQEHRHVICGGGP